MERGRDILIVVIALGWCVACLVMLLLGAGCAVYEDPPQCGRAHPAGGVTVNVRELADDDGGTYAIDCDDAADLDCRPQRLL